MAGAWLYDWFYRRGAPWEIGPRAELVELVTTGRLNPAELPRAVDLGCGTGANPVYLAEHGFEVVGVDFSPVALAKAGERAEAAGVADRCRWVQGDLTDPTLDPGGPFDLVVDYGTLDDLRGARRAAMVATIRRLTHSGSLMLLWCFQANRATAPLFSFKGPSRLMPGLRPGEADDRFGDAFHVERLPTPPVDGHFACYLMQRR